MYFTLSLSLFYYCYYLAHHPKPREIGSHVSYTNSYLLHFGVFFFFIKLKQILVWTEEDYRKKLNLINFQTLFKHVYNFNSCYIYLKLFLLPPSSSSATTNFQFCSNTLFLRILFASKNIFRFVVKYYDCCWCCINIHPIRHHIDILCIRIKKKI